MTIGDPARDSGYQSGPPATAAAIPWAFAGVSHGSTGPFLVQGVDVWQHPWTPTGGPDAAVADPQYGQPYRFTVYRVAVQGRTVTFAAGEFSSGVWGFYTPVWPPPLPSRAWSHVPLAAAVFQVPWLVFVVMINLGPRPPNPTALAVESVLPAVVGLIVGAWAFVGGRAVTLVQRLCLTVGPLACGGICYWLGWSTIRSEPPPTAGRAVLDAGPAGGRPHARVHGAVAPAAVARRRAVRPAGMADPAGRGVDNAAVTTNRLSRIRDATPLLCRQRRHGQPSPGETVWVAA